jgi:hypothetical protein
VGGPQVNWEDAFKKNWDLSLWFLVARCSLSLPPDLPPMSSSLMCWDRSQGSTLPLDLQSFEPNKPLFFLSLAALFCYSAKTLINPRSSKVRSARKVLKVTGNYTKSTPAICYR